MENEIRWIEVNEGYGVPSFAGTAKLNGEIIRVRGRDFCEENPDPSLFDEKWRVSLVTSPRYRGIVGVLTPFEDASHCAIDSIEFFFEDGKLHIHQCVLWKYLGLSEEHIAYTAQISRGQWMQEYRLERWHEYEAIVSAGAMYAHDPVELAADSSISSLPNWLWID